MSGVPMTGVILAVGADTPPERALEVRDELAKQFPGVIFAVAPGAVSSVSFEWEYLPRPKRTEDAA